MKRKRTKHNSVLPLVLSVGMCTSTMMATQVVSTSDALAASASSAVSQSTRGGVIQFKDENLKEKCKIYRHKLVRQPISLFRHGEN